MGELTQNGFEISGTTENRPDNVEEGQQYFNETLGQWQVYDGTDWLTAVTTAASGTVANQQFSAATVVNVLSAGRFRLTNLTAEAAAGSSQGDATAAGYGLNIISGADNTKAIILPSATPVAGEIIIVISTTASTTLPMFPISGEAIDGAGANNAVTLAAATGYSTCILISDGAQWFTILGDTA